MSAPWPWDDLPRALRREARELAREDVPPVLARSLSRLPPHTATAEPQPPSTPAPERARLVLLTAPRRAAALLAVAGLAGLLWWSLPHDPDGTAPTADPPAVAAHEPAAPGATRDGAAVAAPSGMPSAGGATRLRPGATLGAAPAEGGPTRPPGPPDPMGRLLRPWRDLPRVELPGLAPFERLASGASSRARAVVDGLSWPLQALVRHATPR